MQEGISTRARIAILIYSMTNAVLFGIGIILVLNVPSLAAHAWIGIPGGPAQSGARRPRRMADRPASQGSLGAETRRC